MIEIQICKTRSGYIVNVKRDGKHEAIFGHYATRMVAILAGGDIANQARLGTVQGNLGW